MLTPSDVLIDMEKKVQKGVVAEIQKKLTKAKNFFAGKLVHKLGLRFAPELRFYQDNTLDLYAEFRSQMEGMKTSDA